MAAEELVIKGVQDASGCEAGAGGCYCGADGEGDLSHVSEEEMVPGEDEGQAATVRKHLCVSVLSLNSPVISHVLAPAL